MFHHNFESMNPTNSVGFKNVQKKTLNQNFDFNSLIEGVFTTSVIQIL